MISLIPHALKILLKILTNRLESKVKTERISMDLEKVVVPDIAVAVFTVLWESVRLEHD